MKTGLLIGKSIALLLIIAAAIGALKLWFQTYLVGGYYMHSGPFLAIVVGASPMIVLVFAFMAIRGTINLKLSDIVEEGE